MRLVTVPLVLKPEGDQRMNVVGRLKPGVSIREAQANIDLIVSRNTRSLESGRISVEPLRGASLPQGSKIGDLAVIKSGEYSSCCLHAQV